MSEKRKKDVILALCFFVVPVMWTIGIASIKDFVTIITGDESFKAVMGVIALAFAFFIFWGSHISYDLGRDVVSPRMRAVVATGYVILGAVLVLCWTTGVPMTHYGKVLSLGAIVYAVVVLNDVREEHRDELLNI